MCPGRLKSFNNSRDVARAPDLLLFDLQGDELDALARLQVEDRCRVLQLCDRDEAGRRELIRTRSNHRLLPERPSLRPFGTGGGLMPRGERSPIELTVNTTGAFCP